MQDIKVGYLSENIVRTFFFLWNTTVNVQLKEIVILYFSHRQKAEALHTKSLTHVRG